MNKPYYNIGENKKRIITYLSIFLIMILGISFYAKFLPKNSFSSEERKIVLNVNMEKYINYNLSEQDNGTIIQYNINTALEKKKDEEQAVHIKQNQIKLEIGKIDEKYPYDVKVITRKTEFTNGNLNTSSIKKQYNKENGTLIIQASNLNEKEELINTSSLKNDSKDEYTIICYYDTYTQESVEREINIKAQVIVVTDEENNLLNTEENFKGKVKENIGELTSVEYDTEDISNGYIKSNIINGTNYDTEYKDIQKIVVSKKEAQEKIWIRENNTFIDCSKNDNNEEVEKDLENNNELLFKSTKIYKDNLIKILGENGKLEISDSDQNIIAIIDENTNWGEDGTFSINYVKDLTSLLFKTSEIKDVGILEIENTKVIKNSMKKAQNSKIKTTCNLFGISEETTNEENKIENGEELNNVVRKVTYKNKKENIIEIKDSTTNIEVNLNKTDWTNKEQNEVVFDLKLNSTSTADNMFKNPKIKIKLPNEVEKVILGDSHIIYGEELQLGEVKLEQNEDENQFININIDGIQTKYFSNNLELVPNVKIPATIILKKDIENDEANLEIYKSNEFCTNGIEEINEIKQIKLENYKEENTIINNNSNILRSNRLLSRNTSDLQSSNSNFESENIKTEVRIYKGEKELNENDVIYEGEFIKYNIKVTNISDDEIENVSVKATIPEECIYSELEADYNHYMGKYKYNFDESISEKNINIGTLKSGESYNTFYEVKVKDLEESIEQKQIQTIVETFVNAEKYNRSSYINIAKKSEAKVFLGAFLDNAEDRWNYSLKVESEENKQVSVKVKFPKEYKLELRVQAGGQDGTYTPIYLETDKNNILVDTIETNKEYWYEGEVDRNLVVENSDNKPVALTAYATARIGEVEYTSNENRIEYESRSVSVTMTSENEGENVYYGDVIEYEITVKNTGKTNLNQEEVDVFSVDIKDYLPEELEPISMEYDYFEEVDGYWKKKKITKTLDNRYTDERGNRLPDVDLTINIPYKEEIKINIKTTADRVLEKTKIENSAIVTGTYIKAKQSNVISHTIIPTTSEEYYNTKEDTEENSYNGRQGNENDQNKDTINNGQNENNKYISGIVWFDENKDGIKQEDEAKIGGTEVLLIDTNDMNKINSKATTNEDGSYKFDNLTSEKYIIVFKYDTQKYMLTEYKKFDVNENINSDANTQQIKINGETINAGVTDIITLDNSKDNIDMGLIKTGICDLKLDKYISKATVTTDKSTRQYSYNNQKLAKVEIHSKEIEGAKVEIEYKIVVTNEGEVIASPSKIIDYLPQGFEFSKEMNENWGVQVGGELVNTSLSNKKLNPGESCEITLVLTKTMTANTTGQYINTAEISEISNSLGLQDKDSTPGNKKEGEDDYSDATIIISIGTGGLVYIGITITIIAILVVTLFILNKKGKLKNKNIVKIAKLTIFAVIFSGVILAKDNTSWSDGEIKTQLAPSHPTFYWIAGSSRRNAYGSIYFEGTVNGEKWGALCQNAGLPAWSGAYNFGGATGLINNTAQNGNTTKPIITLKKENFENGVNIEKKGEYYIYGPFNINCEVQNKPSGKDVSYSLTLSSNDGIIKTFDIVNVNGTPHSLSGEGKHTFFIKINKNQLNANYYDGGLNGVSLTASIEGENVKVTKSSGYLKYYKNGYQTIKTEERHPAYEYKNSTTLKAEDKESWNIFNFSLEIEKVDADDNKIKLSNVSFVLSTKENNIVKDKPGSPTLIYFKGNINKAKGYDYRNIETGENTEWTYNIEEATKFITDESGKVVFSNLKGVGVDYYRIIEYKNDNPGYSANMPLGGKKAKTCSSSGGIVWSFGNYQESIITNSRTTGNLEITKIDEDTKKPLKGVKFIMRTDDTKSNYIRVKNENFEYIPTIEGSFIVSNIELTKNKNEATEFVTDTNGKIQLYNISKGNYIVEETETPAYFGYDIEDENMVSWETKTDSSTKKMTIETNKPELELLLYNAERKKYIIKNNDEGNYEYTNDIYLATKFITDEDGNVEIRALPSERFIIEEYDKIINESNPSVDEYYQPESIMIYEKNEDIKYVLKDKNTGEYVKTQKDNIKEMAYLLNDTISLTSNIEEATKFLTDKNFEISLLNYSDYKFLIEKYNEGQEDANEYVTVTGTKVDIVAKSLTRYKIKKIQDNGQGNYYIRVFNEANEFVSEVTGNLRIGDFEYTSNINEATTFISGDNNKASLEDFIEGNYQIEKENGIVYTNIYKINVKYRYMDLVINSDKVNAKYRLSRDGQNTSYVKVFNENNEFLDKVQGEIDIASIQYTSNITEATEFIIDAEGNLSINNLPVDFYRVEDVYEQEDKPTIIEYHNAIDEEKTIKIPGNKKEAKVTVVRQASTDTLNKSGNFSSKVTFWNKRKYIKISGYAWEDFIDGKNSVRNNLYDPNQIEENNQIIKDQRLENITVKLYKNDGTLLDTRITDENGEYKFGDYINDKKIDQNGNQVPVDKIKIEDLEGAYIEFEYNGMSYETTDIVMQKDERGNNTDLIEDNSSKVVENKTKNVSSEISKTRDDFNGNYQLIENNKSNAKQLEFDYDVQSWLSKLKLGDNVLYGYNNQTYPTSGVYGKYLMTANTYDANPERLLGQNLSLVDIQNDDVDEIKNVNLGLRRREMPDLAIATDINKVEININGYNYEYTGNKRNGTDSKDIFNATVKAGDKYKNDSYSRELYESDLRYTGENSFEMYATYEIKIFNEATDIISTVNSLSNYFDSNYYDGVINYENKKIPEVYYIDIKENGVKEKILLDSENLEIENYNNNYKKLKISNANIEVKGGKVRSLYVRYKLKNYEGIISAQPTDSNPVILNNYTEINSYSSKKDGKVYGGIDKDSNPGNFNLNENDENRQYNEDDNDKAPAFKLIIIDARQIQGAVFLDKELEKGPGNERKGNGIFDTEEKTISGVKVGLYKLSDFDENGKLKQLNGKLPESQGKTYYSLNTENNYGNKESITVNNKEYYYDSENNMSTSEDGEYIINDFIPGEYKIVYIWGNNTYVVKDDIVKITTQDYKGTIWTTENIEEKYIDGDINGTENTEWYRLGRDAEGNIKEDNTRFTDAKDNWKIREENDNIMESSTNKLVFGIDLNDDIKSEKIEKGLTFINLEKGENPKKAIKFTISNIDFGIIKRPVQSLAITKKVENLNIMLANGQTVIDAKFDDEGNLIGIPKGVNYLPAENRKAQILISLDSELIQGAKADITYKISLKNNSEKDYSSNKYYYYGIPEINEEPIKVQPVKVYDYLDNAMTLNEESNENEGNGTWEVISLSEYNTLTEGKLETTIIEKYLYEQYSKNYDDISEIKEIKGYESFKETYEYAIKEWNEEKIIKAREKRLANKTILHNSNLEKPIEVGANNSVTLKVSKTLSNQDEIDLNNDSEIVKVKNENQNGKTISINLVIEDLYDRAENIVISTNPGKTDYTIEIIEMIAILLIIIATGIFFIKKKVLGKNVF